MHHICGTAVVRYGKGWSAYLASLAFARRAVPLGDERQYHARGRDLHVLTRRTLAQ